MTVTSSYRHRSAASAEAPAPPAHQRACRVTIALAMAMALLAALGFAGESAAASSVPVSIVYRAYQPAVTTVEAGDTVTWTNRGLTPHTVTATAGMFDSGRLDAGASFSVAFSTPGTFLYACTIHPTMKGEVIVRDPSSIPPGGERTTGPPHTANLHVSTQPAANGRRTLVHVQAPRPGARVLLEVSSPAHRAWRAVAHARLSSRGKATLSMSATGARRTRVVVLGLKGEPPLVSPALRRAS